jgi:hypothetical protein
MEKIKVLHLHLLRNDAHVEFMNTYKGRINENPQVKSAVEELFATFAGRLTKENMLYDVIQKSIYTAKIADADHRVDSAVVGIDTAVTAALHLPDPAVQEAAQAVRIRIRAFGHITKKSYEEESAAVNRLLTDLRSFAYINKVALLGLEPYVTELAAAEAVFDEAFKRRLDETTAKPEGRLKEVRREVDGIYHAMNATFDAAMYASLVPIWVEPFIRELNTLIDYFNSHTHRHARKDLATGDHTVVVPIETQKYTEKAVTPIPTVYWREKDKPTVELVFAKDFSVTYKNNVEVGTADLVIHGKGAYKGQFDVKFNIAR